MLNPFLRNVIVLLFVFSPLFLIAQNFDIVRYGAMPGRPVNNAPAIQKAIDACYAHGGGTVSVPAGTFITGTFHLRSNVNLYLGSGAVLLGSERLKDYESYTLPSYGLNYYGILYTRDAENVSITGQGTIDGNNKIFYDFSQAKKIDAEGTKYSRQKENYRKVDSGIGDGPVVPKDRPRQMLIFSNCKNVSLLNISLLNSPFWTLHFADCDGVRVSGIRLFSGLLVPNADGIDITSCSNVIITDSDIRTGDDALAIVGYDHHFEIPGFSGIRHLSENIIVSNCNLQSYSSGIRIGFLDQNTVRNVHVSHVNITNSTRGIGVFLRDEGSLENISFEDMTIETHLRTGDWWGNGEPIHVSAVRGKEVVKLGTIKNLEFRNITCRGENGLLFYGTEESMLKDIRLDNVSFTFLNSKLNDVAGGNIDLRGCLDPRQQIFSSEIPGLYARYVDGFSIHNFKLSWDSSITQPYFTDGISVQHFSGLAIDGFIGTAAPHNKNAHCISLQQGHSAKLDTNDDVYTQQVLNLRQHE